MFRKLFAVTLSAVVLFGCKSTEPEIEKPVIANDFQLAFASGSGNPSGTYLQGVKDLSEGEVSFSGKGYELSSARTARIFMSADGSTVYSLNYTVGTIDKLTYNGGDDYTKVKTFDASIPLGATSVRFTKLNEEKGSVHIIASNPQYADNGIDYLKHTITASIGILDLESLSFGNNYNASINVLLPEDLAEQGYFISRIDCPVLSGDKLYYGTAVSKFNPNTSKNELTDRSFTLVVDYPSLTNATVIETTLAPGGTNGYRTPTQHVNEAGEIFQMISNANTNETTIVKIVNGEYDPTFKFSLNTLLGRETTSNGWFYAGNGIGYIPYEKVGEDEVQIGVDPDGNPTYSSAWGIARMDFNNNTVVDLNTPKGLWLQQYQTSVVRNGKFYIALSPVGVQGYIYIFDINSTDPQGTLGAKIYSGADQYYIGIY